MITLPEDVRAELRKHVERSEMWRVFGFNIDTMTDLFAPLIIEWARKDQAEKDARLIGPKSATMGTFLAGTIRAQFTPETTGAPDDQQ